MKFYLSALEMSRVHCVSAWTFQRFSYPVSRIDCRNTEKSAHSISQSSAFVMNQYHSFTGLNPLSPTLPFLSANVVAHLSPRDHRVYPPESPLRGGISAHVLLSVRRFVSLQSVVGWLLSLSAIFACVRGSLCPFNMSVTWGWHAMQNAPLSTPFTDAPGPHSHIANYLGLSQPWFGLLITWLRLQCVSSLSVALDTGHLLGFSDAIWPGLWHPFSDSLPFYTLKKKERYILEFNQIYIFF